MKNQHGGVLFDLIVLVILFFAVANIPELRSLVNTGLDKAAIFTKEITGCK